MNLEILKKYKQDGLLRSQKHPTLPLEIWNYTEKVQYEDLWDNITLSHRGTIRDLDGNLIAKPFSKFFNIEQNRHKESESFKIYDKMDGSLGILFNYQNQWILATRGSFTSEQAIKGYEILQKYNYQNLDKNLTYCFEIIYPENRIVLNYGNKESLVLLAIFDLQGNEYPIDDFSSIFEIVKKYDFKEYKEIQKLNWDNSEGFIVRFSNGERCKIKFENYVELHRKLSYISEKAVWELICEKKDIKEYLDIVPDEFHKQIKDWYWKIMLDFSNTEIRVKNKFYQLPNFETRKDFALAVKDDEDKAMLFKHLDKKDIYEDICKLIKPSNVKSLIFDKE
jgi:hypothetical protein